MKAKLRRRKPPVTTSLKSSSASTSGSANPHTSASLIRRFHVLIKRRAQLAKRKESTENARELADVEDEIRSMGGLEAYQKMSSIGQSEDRGGGSEKVLIAWLKDLGVEKEIRSKGGKLRLLEVGALKPDNYASCSHWIENHPIDLRSRHPSIQEQDFLFVDQEENKAKWDAISLSLVVNFVPEARDRGRMLRYAHNMLRDEGLLFLALPLPCVSNSRYLTFEHLTQLTQTIGFEQVHERWKEGGKMAYWLYKKRVYSAANGDDGVRVRPRMKFDKKVVLREGKRNNFCILL